MKRIFFLWCLMLLPCLADDLDDLDTLTQRFGTGAATFIGQDPVTFTEVVRTNFHYNGLDIVVISHSKGAVVTSVTLSQSSPLNALQVPDLLKLASSGEWTQKDDNNWNLSKSKIVAHWDGESKISVGAP